MDKSYPAATSGSRSKLISRDFKKIISGPGISHPQKNFTAQLYNAQRRLNMSSNSDNNTVADSGSSDKLNAPGEQFEPGQTADSKNYKLNPAKSTKAPELEEFGADKDAAKEHGRNYSIGAEGVNAPKRNFTS